jgi:hypothetical protein
MRHRPSLADSMAAALLASAGTREALAQGERHSTAAGPVPAMRKVGPYEGLISNLTQDNPWGVYSRQAGEGQVGPAARSIGGRSHRHDATVARRRGHV